MFSSTTENTGSEMDVSVVVTILDEVDSISWLLEGLAKQTHAPVELIIVDGGSEDGTVEKIGALKQIYSELDINLVSEPGSSIGAARNRGVQRASNPWIAFTDAGCYPLEDWLEQMIRTQQATDALIVAGFYHGVSQNALQKAMLPFVLVMPEQVDPSSFLPASRSMLIHKEVFEGSGGFPEHTAVSEDYGLARALKQDYEGDEFAFAEEAIVLWQPRESVTAFFKQLYAMARDDIILGNWRWRVLSVYGRYAAVLVLGAAVGMIGSSLVAVGIVLIVMTVYLTAATARHREYTREARYWTPVLQVVADVAVMSGTLLGLLRRVM